MDTGSIKQVGLLLVLILLACSLCAQQAVWTVPGQCTLRLNSFGTWSLTSVEDHLNPVKLQSALEMQSKFEDCVIMDMEWFSRETPGWDGWDAASIKRLNPSAKVYVYYRVAKHPEEMDWGMPSGSVPSPCNWECPMPWFEIEAHDWWLRDGHGNKVADIGGYYLLDIGKPGFKEKLVEYIKKRSAGKPIDGFILDYAVYELDPTLQGRVPRPAAYPTDQDWFDKAYKPYLEYVADKLRKAGYKIVGICQDYSYRSDPIRAFIRSKIALSIYENWILNWDGTWKDTDAVVQRIQDFNTDPLECWAADGGLLPNIPDFDRKHAAALAMYYISIPTFPTPKRSFHNAGPLYWNPLWDFNIGVPLGQRERASNYYCWARRYTGGMVFLNYEDTRSINYTLPYGRYHDVTGKVYSGRIVLPPKTGLILASM